MYLLYMCSRYITREVVMPRTLRLFTIVRFTVERIVGGMSVSEPLERGAKGVIMGIGQYGQYLVAWSPSSGVVASDWFFRDAFDVVR